MKAPGSRVFAEPLHGHWAAWFEHSPEATFSGRTAAEAVMRLLRSAGFSPEQIEADPDFSRGDRQAFRIRQDCDCPECGGSGRYVGLAVIEPCRACGGTGRA